MLVKTAPLTAINSQFITDWRSRLAISAQLGLALLLAGAMVMAWQATLQQKKATAWEVHTLEVLDATAGLRLSTLAAMRGERGYLLTHDVSFLKPYEEGMANIEPELARLKRLVQDNPPQVARLAKIEGRIDYHLSIMATMIALERDGGHDEAVRRLREGEGKHAIERIFADLRGFEQVERALLSSRAKTRERWTHAADYCRAVFFAAGLILLTVGSWAAMAMRSAMRREAAIRRELERYAKTDELTGLANRRETLASLDRQMATARRYGRSLSIAILDIDYFKRVNDTFGHPAGDEVIRRVGSLATEIMREQDMVGRFGGEEFLIILPETGPDAAMIACDRLRQAIAKTTLVLTTGQAISVTLSAGVAQMTDGDDRTGIIARADTALYDAKAAGRDRVLLAA